MPEPALPNSAPQMLWTVMLGTTVRYRRLFATADGHAHSEVVDAELQCVEYSPPALPLLLTAFEPAAQWGFLVFPVGWRGEPHPSPLRQLVILLAGQVGIAMSDGDQWIAYPGDVALLEDTTGLGHASWNAGTGEALMVTVQLPARVPVRSAC